MCEIRLTVEKMQMVPEFVTEFCVDRHQKINKNEVQCKICQMQARMPQVSNKLLFQSNLGSGEQ